MKRFFEKMASSDDRVDNVLWAILVSKWSPLWVASFWLSGYFVGYYIGHLTQWLSQLF